MAVSTERKIVTVVFADLVEFTPLAEQLDPEDVATIQEGYLQAARETVGLYGGRLEKFIGDAVMAVFGVPAAADDDAERAVRAALALVGSVEQLGARLGLAEGRLRVRVGVNSGEVLEAAEPGPERGLVTGDTVNVAARLQAAAEPGEVIVGETTALAVADAVELGEPRELALKGKQRPVRATRALQLRAVPSREHALGRLHAPIVGRAHELGRLRDALTRVADGRAERWLIVALPGIGKTRLVGEFGAAVEGARVLHARTRPHVLAPYDVVGQLFRDAVAGLGDADEVAALLRGRLEATGATAGRAGAIVDAALPLAFPLQRLDAARDREQLHADWTAAFDALAGDAPAVWVVEDVHWASGDLLAFLHHAGSAPSASGRLVLTTTRPGLLEHAPRWCDEWSDGGPTVLHLPPLDASACAELVRALVGDILPAPLVAEIARRSDGNPLFTEELLRTWIGVGTLAWAGAGWRFTSAPDRVELPETVEAIYDAQIDDLPPAARLVLRRAAVVGRRFALRALEPLELADVEEGLEVLRRRALLVGPEDDPRWGPTYVYRHALLRDVGYASLPRGERARLHVRCARWYEHEGGDPDELAEVIARHYASALEAAPALAPELDRAATAALVAAWLERAGDYAERAAANDTAVSLFREALDLTEPAAAADRARRLVRLGRATAAAADMDEGIAEVEEALEAYRSLLADPEHRAEGRSGCSTAASSLGSLWVQQMRFGEAAELAERTLAEIGPAEDEETAHLLVMRLSARYALGLDFAESDAAATRVIAIARAAGNGSLELDGYEWFLPLFTFDRQAVARLDWERLEGLARSERRWQTLVHALQNRAAFAIDDDTASAWPLLDAADEIAEAHVLTECLAWSNYVRAEAGLLAGDWDRAVEAGLRGIEIGRANAYHRVVLRIWLVLGEIAAARGDRELLEQALAWWTPTRAVIDYDTNMFSRVMFPALDRRLHRRGLLAEPAPCVERSLPALGVIEPPSARSSGYLLVDSWVEDGELEAGRQGLAALAAAAAPPRGSGLARAVERAVAARVALAEGDEQAAAEAARAALAGFRASAAPWWTLTAIGLLERAGAASPGLSAEADELERHLRVETRAVGKRRPWPTTSTPSSPST